MSIFRNDVEDKGGESASVLHHKPCLTRVKEGRNIMAA